MIFICVPLFGQYSDDTKVHYTVNDGLPSSTCYDVLQDDKGFLYIASESGLTKFDGFDFKTFTTSNGLVDNEVVKIEKDSYGRIWMNTNRELTFMQNDSIVVVDSLLNSTLKWNFKVEEDSFGILWVSRVNSLKVYNAKTLEPLELQDFDNSVPGDYFIAGIHDKGMWIAHQQVLYKFEGTKCIESIPFDRYVSSMSHYSSFFQVDSKYLFYSHEEKMHKFNLDTKEESIFCKLDGKIRQLEIINNEAWLLTENSLNQFRLDKDKNITSNEKMLEGALCSRFAFDENQNLWVAIYKNGLMMFTPDQDNLVTTDFDAYGSSNLESVLVDNDKIVIGSEKGDFYIVQDGKTRAYNLGTSTRFPVDRVIDILVIGDEEYLISSDSGIHHFKNEKLRMLVQTNSKNFFLKDDKLLVNCYNGLFEASKNELLKLNSPIKRDTSKLKKIRPNRSYSSIIDSKNTLWNANVISGLTRISGQDTFYFKSLSNVFNATISRLIELENGLICAVTKGEGVILIKDKTYRQIKLEDGLSSNFCYDVSTEENKIFVATNKGVSIITLNKYKELDFSINILDMHHGLKSNEVQDVEYDDGDLYLATNAGLVKFDLQSTKKYNQEKQLFIQDFIVNGTKRNVLDKYELGPFENNIRINYIAPDISSSLGTIYAYQLEGVDDHWIHTASKETHYSNLVSGSYRFKYKLASANDIDDDFKFIDISIEPRFIHSMRFKFLILSFLGLLFAVPLYFSHFSQKQSFLNSLVQKKSSEVDEKMRLLERSNARLVSSNKELEQFAYIASHDLQEPINTIKGFSDILKNKFQEDNDSKALEMLGMISSSSSRMKSLVQDLLVFSRIGKTKKKSMVDMNLLMEDILKDMTERIKNNNAKVSWANLPYIPGYRVELRSLFQNLLSNAMKFQKEGIDPVINITAKKLGSGVEFSVKDNGIGIGPKHKERIFEIFQRLHNKDEYEGTGIGLAHCKKIVNLHHGDIWVESELGKGCNFKFTLEI